MAEVITNFDDVIDSLDVIERIEELESELDEAFHRLADDRWREVEAGATVEWDEARAWVEARLRGEGPARPR